MHASPVCLTAAACPPLCSAASAGHGPMQTGHHPAAAWQKDRAGESGRTPNIYASQQPRTAARQTPSHCKTYSAGQVVPQKLSTVRPRARVPAAPATGAPCHAAQQVPDRRQLARVDAELERQHARNKGGQLHGEALQHTRTRRTSTVCQEARANLQQETNSKQVPAMRHVS